MSCDPDKLDCPTNNCKCSTLKERYEACCGGENKKCRCQDQATYDAEKEQYKTDNSSNPNIVPSKQQEFVKAQIKKLYGNRKKKGCKISPQKCQQKSKCFFVKKKDDKEKCCPGQTGHHLIPGCLIRAKISETDYSSVDHSNAPTVCTSGGSYNIGTHGLLHYSTRQEFDPTKTSEMSFDEACQASIKAHKKVFSKSLCSDKCMLNELKKDEKDGGYSKAVKNGSYSRKDDGGCAAEGGTLEDLKEVNKNYGSRIGSSGLFS